MTNQQLPSWASPDANVQIRGADDLAIARILGTAEWAEQSLFTDTNQPRTAETIWVGRVPMRIVLRLKGSASDDFTFVESQSAKPEVNQMGSLSPFTKSLAGATPGVLTLVWLNRPDNSGLFPSPIGSNHYFRRRDNNEFVYPAVDSVPILPAAEYELEGQTAVEKYCSILVQAYAADPLSPKGVTYLRRLAIVKPWWKRVDGVATLSRPDMDGPGFFGFARSKLVPRLMAGQGGDLIGKIRANYFAYILVGDSPLKARHQQLIEVLDSTWPNANEKNLIEGLVGDQAYFARKLNARLASVRAAAITSIALERSNIGLVLQRLREESVAYVQLACADWFQKLKSANIELYAGAPVGRTTPFGSLENRQALIDYWQDH